nr:hypothetical protein 1634Bnrm1_p099 [Cryptomonas sp.]
MRMNFLIYIQILNITIRKQVWVLLLIHFIVSIFPRLNMELNNMLIIFRILLQKIISIKIIDYLLKKKNLKQNKKSLANEINNDLFFLTKNISYKIYLNIFRKKKMENLTNLKMIKKTYTKLIKLKRLKNLYKKIFGIKFKKRKKKLYVVYSNINPLKFQKKFYGYLEKNVPNNFYSVNTFPFIKGAQNCTIQGRSLTVLLIQLRNFFIERKNSV